MKRNDRQTCQPGPSKENREKTRAPSPKDNRGRPQQRQVPKNRQEYEKDASRLRKVSVLRQAAKNTPSKEKVINMRQRTFQPSSKSREQVNQIGRPTPSISAVQYPVQRWLSVMMKQGGIRRLRVHFVHEIAGYKNAHGTKKAFDEDRNADFNRYSDVVLWDATRVRLRRGPGGNDYIHASHVKGGDFPMICAQGPVEESVERFWIMIVEQNCQIVVQLCQNEEDGKEKCFRYLPAAEHEKFGAVSVKVKEMTKTMPSNQEVKRTILEASFAGRTIEVVHLLYDGWPDHDVPLNPNYFRHLRTYVHKLATAKKCTVVIHCSAGIGRTGTYAAIEMAVRDMVKNDTEVQMSNIVPVLRDQRASAVQTDLQYVFIHRAVIDAAKEAQKLTTAADKDKIASFVTEYEQLVVRKRKERLDILNAKK